MTPDYLPRKLSEVDKKSEYYKQFIEFKKFCEALTTWDKKPSQLCYQSFSEGVKGAKNARKLQAPHNSPHSPHSPQKPRVKKPTFVEYESEEDLWQVFRILHYRYLQGYYSSIAQATFKPDKKGELRCRKRQVDRCRAYVVDIDSFLSKDILAAVIKYFGPSFTNTTSTSGDGYKAHLYFLIEQPNENDNYEVAQSKQLVQSYSEVSRLLAFRIEQYITQLCGDSEDSEDILVDKQVVSSKLYRCAGLRHRKNPNPDYHWLVRCVVHDLEGFIPLDKKLRRDWLYSLCIDEEFKKTLKAQQRERLLGAMDIETSAINEEFEGVSEGERDVTMFMRIGNRARGGMDEKKNLEISLAENEKNIPPLDVDVVVDKVSRAYEEQDEFKAEKQAQKEEAVEKFQAEFQAKMASEGSEEDKDSEGKSVEYDYTNKVDFSDVLSERSIKARLSQRIETDLYSSGDEFFVYSESEGLFKRGAKSNAKVFECLSEIITDMVHEKCVFEEFVKVSAKGKERFEENRLKRFIGNLKSANKLTAISSLIHKDPSRIVDVDEFDAYENFVLCKNAVLELKENGEVVKRKFSSKFKFTKRLGCEFDEAAYQNELTSNTNNNNNNNNNPWHRFLWDVMEHDVERIRYLQRCVGYALSASLKEQVLFFLRGPSASGKSTFLQVLEALFGDYAASISTSIITKQKYGGNDNFRLSELAGLVGKRAVICEEIEQGDILSCSSVKNITDKRIGVKCKHMRHDAFTMHPNFIVFLQGNYDPLFDASDDAIWRRLHYLPFLRHFEEHERDDNLSAKLTAEHTLNEILAWALVGYKEWRKIGLQPPESCTAFKEEKKESTSLLNWFLHCEDIFEQINQEQMELMQRNQAGGIQASDLWQSYNREYDKIIPSVERIESQTKFGIELKKHGVLKYLTNAASFYCLKLNATSNTSRNSRSNKDRFLERIQDTNKN